MCHNLNIHVVCVASENKGRTHGVWIDATKNINDIYQDIITMLSQSPEKNAERFAILGTDGAFGFDVVAKYSSITYAHRAAMFVKRHGELGAALLEERNNLKSAERLIAHNYCGEHESEEAYAKSFYKRWHGVPEEIDPAIDYAKAWDILREESGFFSIFMSF